MNDKENAILNNEIIGAISKLYWLIYQMDLVDGTYEEISAGQEMHRLTGKSGNTEEVFKEARETIVSLEYQEGMKEFLDTSTLNLRLQNTESISTEYRAKSGSWHRARFIVKKRDSLGKVLNVLYVVRQIDEEKQAQLQYEQKLSRHNLILSGLSIDYTIAFVVNLDTDDYEIVFNQQTNHAKIENDIAKFENYVARYTENFVLPEYRIAMRHELNSTTIAQHFKTREDYHFSFETVPNAAGLSCFQAHIVKQYNGEYHFAFLGFRSVDEIVKKERFYKNALQKANDALKRQLDLITSSLPGGVKISNDDSTYSFKYVSEQFANMLGYKTPEELMKASGGSIWGLAHPDDFDAGLADALEQYSKADHYAITYRMKCKDGSWKYIEDRGNKIQTSDGTIEHWNLILDNDELMRKTIALEIEKKSNQNKLDFLSRMSHDMRTPLNGIMGLLDMCDKHPDDRQLVDASRLKAKVAAEHLLSLINDTLELSNLENNSALLYEEIFYIPTLLREVETIAQIRADEEKITIFYECDMRSLTYKYLIGSPLYVRQILLNLITNAIKYNKENGRVYCTAKERIVSNEEVVLKFTVQDTGIGMSKEFLKDIFKPFEQADHGPRSTYMGTGLGMAIVKNLLDRMNGIIQINSVEGKGTIINVEIPFKIAINKELLTQEQSKKSQAEHESLQVLLVEDNELNREIASFILEDEGMKVVEAIDGQEAVSTFLKSPEYYFDVILMDIMMPIMDGYEATKTIRNCKKEDAKTIPIIAITANTFDEDVKKCFDVGMNAHLAKPLDIDKVIDTINKFC